MESIIIDEDKKEKYPYLGINTSNESQNTGLIVLFNAANTGIVVRSVNDIQIGTFFDDWPESYFEEFKGKLLLKN